jgi:bacterioferritin-associated ferredoxin
MIVCSCNVVSDATIKAALEPANGKPAPRTPSAVYKCLGCSPNCGRCFVTVRKIISDSLAVHPHQHTHAPGCDAPRDAEPTSLFEGVAALVGGV